MSKPTKLQLVAAGVLLALCTHPAGAAPGSEADPLVAPTTMQLTAIDDAVSLEITPRMSASVTDEAVEDMVRLGNSVSELVQQLSLAGRRDPAERVVKPRVVFVGRGAFTREADIAPEQLMADSEIELAQHHTRGVDELTPGLDGVDLGREDGVAWDVVRVETGNEFQVILPRSYLDAIGARGEALGLDRGSPDPENELAGARLEDLAHSASVTPRGWSHGQDSRSRLGRYNFPQTSRAYRRLVSLYRNGGCSGTLVGPRHILTAAHCIRDFRNSRWFAGSAYAGRSGPNAWRARASFSPSAPAAATWYWTPRQFRVIADGRSQMPYRATPYDIGMIITHTSRMGDVVGWLGWYWTSSDSAFANRRHLNRGYPVCGAANSPARCERFPLALWGDVKDCSPGNFSADDANGHARRFRFGCDVSGGHSGSSLYSYFGASQRVTGIVSWEHCRRCGPSDHRPNTGVRITKQYSDWIAFFRQIFP